MAPLLDAEPVAVVTGVELGVRTMVVPPRVWVMVGAALVVPGVMSKSTVRKRRPVSLPLPESVSRTSR